MRINAFDWRSQIIEEANCFCVNSSSQYTESGKAVGIFPKGNVVGASPMARKEAFEILVQVSYIVLLISNSRFRGQSRSAASHSTD